MSEGDFSRRDLIRSAAISITAGSLTAEAAQHVHQHAEQEKQANRGVYKPKLFNAHEYKTITRLAEIIIPKDEVSGSAVEAGAPEFMDLIGSHNEEMATRLVGGISWLDAQMSRETGKRFIEATPAQQTAMLDRIASREKASEAMYPGVVFFDWVRRLTADAFYTSPIGVKDVGYVGNKGMAVFQVPESALRHALQKSRLG
jgi:hypothetical protein